MIGTGDIGNIIYKACEGFGIEVCRDGNIPTGELTDERITVYVKQLTRSDYWDYCMVNVNFNVPDVNGQANLSRLGTLEREAKAVFDSVGEWDGSYYRYSVESTQTMPDRDLKCHFVNVSLLFEIMNIK